MKESDKTKIYSANNKTTTYGDSEKRTKESVHNLKAGDKLILNENEYQIIKIISESTGEAVIYKVEDTSKNIFALKLYYEFHHAEYEPNTEALSRIITIEDEDILKLFDFGTGINKYKGRYCFEISDFAFGFDLLSVESLEEKYSPDFITHEVIPQIFKGILRLHDNKIYHCDLKPQNVFYLDKEQKQIVIGDYGSSKTFEFDVAKSSRKTTTVKGTDFYLPPEQARGFISEKNDYYSFGMILLHLFYPKEILINENEPKSLSHAKLKQIIERQFEAKPIIDFNPDYKRINSLIEGLTLVDFNLRWGKEQVQQWIEGKEVKVDYIKSAHTEYTTHISDKDALKFGKYIISTPQDLRHYILNDKNWYEDLIEDKDNREDFFNWMLKLYGGDRSKRSALNRIIKQYSPEGIDFIAEAIIRFFIREHPVTFGLKSFNFAESNNLKKTTAEAFAHLIFNLWDNSSEKDIRFYFFSYEFALRHTKNMEEANKALKILYNTLKINENSDFEDYKVYAYTSVSKKSFNNIKLFLYDYLPAKNKINFISLDNQNILHYTIKKSLNNYFSEIGINLSFEDKYEETTPVRYPEKYNSLDGFIKHLTNNLINNIYSKNHTSKNTINENDILYFKQLLKENFNNRLYELTKDYRIFFKKNPRKVRQLNYIKENLEVINSIIKKKFYHRINDAQVLLENTKKYASQKLTEQKQVSKKRKLFGILDNDLFPMVIGVFGPIIIGLIAWGVIGGVEIIYLPNFSASLSDMCVVYSVCADLM